MCKNSENNSETILKCLDSILKDLTEDDHLCTYQFHIGGMLDSGIASGSLVHSLHNLNRMSLLVDHVLGAALLRLSVVIN